MGRVKNVEKWARFVACPLPRWIRVHQEFAAPEEASVELAVRRELSKPGIRRHLRVGSRVALGIGSRGLAEIELLVRTVVEILREAECYPFIVPAMGSHGGGTVPGQREVLESYGVTENRVGAPIISSTEVVELARLPTGMPVFFDALALAADLVIPINRIKPHTAFTGPIESGLTKMLVVGFGKHPGAIAFHKYGAGHFSDNLIEAGQIVLSRTQCRFGLALVENARHHIARIEAIEAPELLQREQALLEYSMSLMPALPVDELDVLVVGNLGKDISGSGMDTNVTGRSATGPKGHTRVDKLVVLNLTDKTHGNAMGIGMADVTTERVLDSLDYDATWINAATSTLASGRIPVSMPSDSLAIQLAVKTCKQANSEQVRLIYIQDTLRLENIYISEALWNEHNFKTQVTPRGGLEPIPFNAAGNLPVQR